jgi:hypothetical protein
MNEKAVREEWWILRFEHVPTAHVLGM